MKWKIEVAEAPAKFLRKLRDHSLKRRLVESIRLLETEPRPSGCSKLQGTRDAYRIRVSDYRIIYKIEDAVLTVLVVEIGHRREIYR